MPMSILLLFLPQSIASLLSHAQDRPGQRLLGPLAAPIRTCLSCSNTASRALFLSRFAFPCITAFKTAGRRRNAQASGPIIAIGCGPYRKTLFDILKAVTSDLLGF